MQLKITNNQHDPDPYWETPIPSWLLDKFTRDDIALFDQNGYDMTVVEQCYAMWSGYQPQPHRIKYTNKVPWMEETEISNEGPHLNHCDLYMRRGFAGEALDQIQFLAQKQPIFNKLAAMRPKWGVDISIDYADLQENVFELLHFEWDSFKIHEVYLMKEYVEARIKDVDWDFHANQMLSRKEEWKNLDFFAQSDWKQAYWGLPKEQFKEVIWR